MIIVCNVTMHLSKPIGYATQKVHPNVNYKLQLIMIIIIIIIILATQILVAVW